MFPVSFRCLATRSAIALLSGLAILLGASGATAQSTTVIPIGMSATEGSSSSSSLFQTGAATVQAYYTEAFLAAAGITPGVTITGLAYRRTGGGTTGPAGDTTINDYRIFLSGSVAAPASITTTFANNVVGPQTLVRSGPLTFTANSFPGGATPNAFGQMIDFTTPYAYTGGSLLFEIRRSARTGNTTAFNTDTDGVGSTAGARWVFNTTSDAALTGSLVNGAQIFQVRFTSVPEPGTLALISLVSTGSVWAARRVRKVRRKTRTKAIR